ncbi:MAG: IS21 family transposase, partial [Actinomycetota bacterium]
MRRVELFELIRRDAREGASIRSLAKKYGVHRRVVRQALASAVPPVRRPPQRTRPALTPEITRFIEAILQADKKAPRKQRHTALRIWQRVRDELRLTVGESTVRHHVAGRRRELGIGISAYVPQHHTDAAQAEVDFYEADVVVAGRQCVAKFISVRSEASGVAFHRAYPRATQAALFDGIARGLEFCGGVFEIMRFDNLRHAVAGVLRGNRRVEQDRFIAFRSHYGFASSFTSLGIQGAHEKGGVEGEVGRYRRRWLTPVPAVEDFAELNDYLFDCCITDLDRRIAGRGESVGDAAARERALLRALPAEHFEIAEITEGRVDAKCRVTVRTNRYSVPARLVGRVVQVRLTPLEVEISHEHAVVARHPRLHLKWGEHLELDHYLELCRERPGAFAGSEPLHQARERGAFPAHYDKLWRELMARWGERDGTRQMIDVLLLHRRY